LENIELTKEEIEKKNKQKEEFEIQESIDSALLYCYLKTKEDLLSSFLKFPNHCNIKYSEELLFVSKVFYFF
jgi:hypothetical protein